MKRRCPHCSAFLRASNEGPLCAPCERTEERAAAEKQAKLILERTPASSMVAAIHDALPGTASQIALATGLELDKVRRRLVQLACAGRIARRPIPRVGSAGEYTEYHRIEELTQDDLDDLMGTAA